VPYIAKPKFYAAPPQALPGRDYTDAITIVYQRPSDES
jgi:hypothetical protein